MHLKKNAYLCTLKLIIFFAPLQRSLIDKDGFT